MNVKIHPTAIVDPRARLAADVEIGACSIIGGSVSIGAGSVVANNCLIEGESEIGPRCRIFSGAVIGGLPQDLKYRGEKSRVIIGADNVIREFVTINLATGEGDVTRVGSHNLIMAYSHIAHNCTVGSNVVMANGATLAGHVTIEDRAIVGGLVAIHQFVRIGTLAIIGGCSKVVQDVPPYTLVDGHPVRLYGINSIGLRRAGISPGVRSALKTAVRILIVSGLSTSHALEKIRRELPASPELDYLLAFIRNSQRGICRGPRRPEAHPEPEVS